MLINVNLLLNQLGPRWHTENIHVVSKWPPTINLCVHFIFVLKTDLYVESICTSENLKRCHGRITDQQVERLGRLAGPMGEQLDKLFSQKLGDTYISSECHAVGMITLQLRHCVKSSMDSKWSCWSCKLCFLLRGSPLAEENFLEFSIHFPREFVFFNSQWVDCCVVAK